MGMRLQWTPLLLWPLATLAVDNGIGLTPPMGWRHWKAFYADISQEIMETMMDEMAKQYPDGEGGTVSLKDLGYLYVGLDDHWQNCTRVCANGTVIPSWFMNNDFDYQSCANKWGNGTNNTGSTVQPWYDDDGNPRVDTHRFPDMKAMVSKAHSLGLRAGWYFGNYQCRDAMGKPSGAVPWDLEKLAAGSVRAIVEYGFDSVKLDSGFPVASNMTLWAELLNKTGRPVMIENCHQGGLGPGMSSDAASNHNCTGLSPVSDCPFNFWRTTGDPEPGWGTIMRELNTLRSIPNPNYPPDGHKHPPYNANPPRSRPGGWAYPGTMVVGDGDMTYSENEVHFGSWCIVSSPLILAFNLSDPVRHDLVWDIITNKEAITVNQAWVGHPGSQVVSGAGNNSQVEVWTKPLGDGRTAAFILNTADLVEDPSLHTTMIPCNASAKSQRWRLSDGIAPGSGNVTNLMNGYLNQNNQNICVSIWACSEQENAHLGIGGCKKVPSIDGCSPDRICDCNGAWRFNSNDTITSVMDDRCLDWTGSLGVNNCSKTSSQQFRFITNHDQTITIKQGDLCMDLTTATPPPTPSPPTPGAFVNISLKKLNLAIDLSNVRVRDIWAKKDLPSVTDSYFVTSVPHHGSRFIVLMQPNSTWPEPFRLAPWMRKVPTHTQPYTTINPLE